MQTWLSVKICTLESRGVVNSTIKIAMAFDLEEESHSSTPQLNYDPSLVPRVCMNFAPIFVLSVFLPVNEPSM